MTKDEALKLALEALERGETELRWKAITAIREALAQPEHPCVACEGNPKGNNNPCAVCGLAQPEQEPVATWENKYGMKEWQVHALRAGWSPTPPHRKPLTDEEIGRIAGDCLDAWSCARAIEAAHGIKE